MKTKMKQKKNQKCNAIALMKGKNVTYSKTNFLASYVCDVIMTP